MDLTGWVGLWGGIVSTTLGALQFITWRRARPRLVVACDISRTSTSAANDENTVGTLIRVRYGNNILKELVAIAIDIANHGDKALQVAAVVVESIEEEGRVTVWHITPDSLPAILEPRTSLRVLLQKEFLDMVEQVSFFGVVDALARRHGIPVDSATSVINQAWALPTRAYWVEYKEDPLDEPARRFQALQAAVMTSRPANKRDIPFISRPTPTPPDAGNANNTNSSTE